MKYTFSDRISSLQPSAIREILKATADPAIIPFLIVKENMDAEQIDEYLNRRSGVLGISGLSSDFRDLESAAHRGDERSQLAIDVFAYRVKKYIGAYTAAMGGVDAIVFTAGLGGDFFFLRGEN